MSITWISKRKFIFQPVLMDMMEAAKIKALPNDIVHKCNLFGCPPSGTMGQTYICSTKKEFLGMVSVNSLIPFSKKDLF